jgi:single-strand DNA-binding protein
MPNFQKLIIIGHLTRDPQLSYTPNQTAVVEFGIATNRNWIGQDGTKQEEVLFVDCVMYGKRATAIREYVSKGDPLLIEGRLKLDTWKDQEGNNRSKHRVIVENFQFMGSPKDKPQGSQQAKPDVDEDPEIPF